MNSADHVWANSSSATPPASSSSLWLSTLSDIISQWGWLFAAIAVGCIVTLAFGDRPQKEK